MGECVAHPLEPNIKKEELWQKKRKKEVDQKRSK